ncbi:MAG: hypothetical protein E6G01_13575 [Actinobacteria bacterium]|nr:MAG: hypothetical protein E6G01_13575 [Actinomycetota bacterium]
MRACSRARGGAFAAIGLIVLITGGVTGVTLGELALMQPSVQQAQPARGASHAPIKAKLASVGSPCGLGSVGAGNGWGLPLPARYLVNGSVDQGVDYAAPGGTPECAMGDGTIIAEGGQTLNGFGPWAPALHIDDGPLAGRTVYYGHAGPDLVPVGAHVANGQQITEVGNGIVGLSTGPHLEVGFYPPGRFGAGQPMLDYINSTRPSDNSSCTVWAGHQVCGAIRDKYLSLGGAFVLGWPLNDETPTPDQIGRFSHFSNNWSIYWTPNSGAWSIHGAILDKWAAMGWETSVLGYPTTDEGTTPDKVGRYNYFSGHGAIYWTPNTGAWSIHGAILDKWASMGWETSVLAYPRTDETGTPDGIGRFNHFANDGSIYWTPGTGASSIHGAIRDHWAAMGWETSVLGYPVTDETGTPDGIGRFNHFANDGSIYWTPATGAREVHGLIRAKWASLGWERGCLGYPISDTTSTAGGERSAFQQGAISFDATTAQVTSSC